MKATIDFPKANTKSQEKLFSQLKWCCSCYDKSLSDESVLQKEIWMHQAYGMVSLYISLYPEDEAMIDTLWDTQLKRYLLR